VTAIKTATKPERPTGHGRGAALSKKQRDVITPSSEDDESIDKSKKPLVSRFADKKTNPEIATEDVSPKHFEAHQAAPPRTPPPTHPSSSSSVYASPSRKHPILSPGARARLEIFDYMMGTGSDEGDANIYENAAYNATDNLEPYDSPNLAPKFPKPTSTTTMTAGRKRQLRDSPSPGIVPETDSSQPRRSLHKSRVNSKNTDASPPPKPPPSRPTSPLGKSQSVPPIVVMRASSSSKSPLHSVRVASNSDVRTRPRKPATRPIPRISPETFRKTVGPFTSELDNEPPMSSIESFPSPRKDKGKQRQPADADELQGSSDDEAVPGPTDAELRARGEALYEQALTKKKLLHVTDTVPKKALGDIAKSDVPLVNSKRSTSGKGDRLGNLETVQQMEDAYVDLSGGNSTTIDTFTQSGPQNQEARPTAVRQEVEESTQEALLGGNPALPANVAGKIEAQPHVIGGMQTEREEMETRQISPCKEAEQITQDVPSGNVPVNVAENVVEPQELAIDYVDICGEDGAQVCRSAASSFLASFRLGVLSYTC